MKGLRGKLQYPLRVSRETRREKPFREFQRFGWADTTIPDVTLDRGVETTNKTDTKKMDKKTQAEELGFFQGRKKKNLRGSGDRVVDWNATGGG